MIYGLFEWYKCIRSNKGLINTIETQYIHIKRILQVFIFLSKNTVDTIFIK